MGRVAAFLLTLMAAPACAWAQEFSEAIEDNSFLIEEAYNQEDRVVQHISNFVGFPGIESLLFTFTQEWPLGSMTHQLSYTIPYLSAPSNGSGIGDIQINYRYQLLHNDAQWGDIAPRLTAILPTGSKADGLGSGAYGVQFNLPVSRRWTDAFITHVNAGFTTLIDAEGVRPDGTTVRRTLFSYILGGSGIFLMTENFNLLLELLFSKAALLVDGAVKYESIGILNPGFRFAFNAGSLQIVPGLAIPIQFAPGRTDLGVFAYLSFEHPF